VYAIGFVSPVEPEVWTMIVFWLLMSSYNAVRVMFRFGSCHFFQAWERVDL
jgi:hypothetical protein